MTETQTSTPSSSKEEAVPSDNSRIVNQSGENGTSKRVRHRSRRRRSTSLLSNSGLNFHYAVGFLLIVTLVIVIFSNKISKKIWAMSHPITGTIAKGPHASVLWFRVELLAVFLGIVIWLYLLPGFADRFLAAFGLVKERDHSSRRRHR